MTWMKENRLEIHYTKNFEALLRNRISDRFRDICREKVDSGFMTVMKDVSLKTKNVKGEYLINKIQDFVFDDVLFKYTTFKPVVDIAESIIGPNITVAHSMLINKPPDSEVDASRHPLHQDLHYFPFRPAASIVAVWTAMEYVHEQNGCLFVIPGSHKGELYQHDYPENVRNKVFHGVKGFDHLPKQYLIMEKGTTVFFHPLILHGSGPNFTKGFRKAISCHYANSNCNFIDVRGTIQENVGNEVVEIARKRGVPRISYQMLWKLKSRLVRGQPGNFQNWESHL